MWANLITSFDKEGTYKDCYDGKDKRKFFNLQHQNRNTMKWYFCQKCNEWYNEGEAEKFNKECPECEMELAITCPKCLKPEKKCKCRKK